MGTCCCVGSGESGGSGAKKTTLAWSLRGQGSTSTGRIPSQDLQRPCSRDGMVPVHFMFDPHTKTISISTTHTKLNFFPPQKKTRRFIPEKNQVDFNHPQKAGESSIMLKPRRIRPNTRFRSISTIHAKTTSISILQTKIRRIDPRTRTTSSPTEHKNQGSFDHSYKNQVHSDPLHKKQVTFGPRTKTKSISTTQKKTSQF